MALFSIGSTDKWKKHYQELSQEFEAFKKQSRLQVADFKEALDNVSLAAEGIDQELDFQIKRIRNQLNSRAEPSHICNTARAILEAKKRFNKQAGATLKETILKLIEFSYTLPNANQIQSDIKAIQKQLHTVDDQEIPKILQSLTLILKNGLDYPKVEAQATMPWYKKLFTLKKSKLNLKPLTTILNYLISHLNVPTHLEEELEHIKEMIETNDENNILTALELTSQLVIKIHKINEAQFNQFLSELNAQIAFIEEILFQHGDNQQAQKAHTQKFNDNLQSYFSTLSEEVSHQHNLDELKTHMMRGIQTLMEKVTVYTEKQMAMHQDYESKISKLNEKVRETELVTHSLMDKLSKTTIEALQDPLTELPNRAAYDKRIAEEYARWQRFQHHLIMMVCDIDHFKAINDNYGHKAGDKVLYKVAQTLKANLRKIDFVGRYGGEEFVILIEKVSLEDASKIADKIRREIASLGFHFNQRPVQVTASLGVTQFKSADTPDSAFERADKALYESKNNGRNQVSILN